MKMLFGLEPGPAGKRAIATVLALLWVGPAHALLPPKHREPTPNYDCRTGTTLDVAEKNRQQAGLNRLRAQLPTGRVDFDPWTGSPKFIRALDGFLTGPEGRGRAVSHQTARAFAATDPYRAVKAFLTEHADLFGHDASVLTAARIVRDSITPHNGLRTVVWEQTLDGIPVFEAVLVGHITKQGELAALSSLFLPDPTRAANAGTPNRASIQINPPVQAEEALIRAATSLNDTLAAAEVVADGTAAGGAYARFRLPYGRAHLRQVWFPLNRHSMRPAWEIWMPQRSTREQFQVLVDAETGELLIRRHRTYFLSDATYNVYTSDSPSPFSPGWPTPNAGQPPLTNRVLVTLAALDTVASPDGWIADQDNETRGNNADTFPDRDFDTQPDGGARPQGNLPRTFDFPLDLTQDPLSYTNAAAVQLFYWLNWHHDVLYRFGFTESAGNFQENNFGRGGLGGDSVISYVQAGADLGFANNAFFAPAPDGINGQTAMFIWDFPRPSRDGDLDAEIIFHEATPGTSWRLVGGGMGLGNLQGDGMGEGWSDFYALCLLSEPGDDPDATYAMGGYVTYRLYGLQENYYFGVRHFPYSTDMSKNPFTFKDIDPNQISSHPGVPRSPIYPFDPREADEVHHQGEVWCSALWEVRANLVRKYGLAGNQLAIQLVTDGMKLTPAQPNFLQGRDAIILADLINNGGANAPELWAGFAKRGMGFSASSPDGSTTVGVVEAFDTPGLNVQGYSISGGNGNGVIDLNECNDLSIVLANFNSFTATGIRVTLSTTTPGVGFGNNVSDYLDLPPLAVGTNLVPFRISTAPEFVCGQPVTLTVLVKSDQTTITNTIILPTGSPGSPVRFDNNTPIVIPDDDPNGTNSFIVVSNLTTALRKVAVSLHITHSFDADLKFELIAPDGTRVKLSDTHGGSGDNYGVACTPLSSRTTFDDEAALPISAAVPPFVGTFKPDEPLARLAGRFGTNLNGVWRLHLVDQFRQDVGTLQCWSLILTPAQCTDGGGTCPGVDLGLGITDNPDPVFVGSNLVYSISVTNFGPSPASNVVVQIPLPSSVVFVSANSSQGSCSEVAGTVVCNLGQMPFARRATITVIVRPLATGLLSTTATVSAKDPDPNISNNSATTTTLVTPPAAELALALADAPDPTIVGGPLTYTVSVTNNGPAVATGVTVTNLLPISVNVLSVTPSQGSVTVSANTVVCNFGALAVGANASATIQVRPTAPGTLVATATVRALQADPLPGNNTATATTTVGPAVDLTVTFGDTPDPVVVGSNWLYSVTVTNLGPNPASSATLNVTLPSGVTVVSFNTTRGTISRSGNTLTCSLGSLPVGDGALVTVILNSTNAGVFNASASAAAAEADPHPSDNTATQTTTVAEPFVSIVAAGATLTAESLSPANGTVDVGETVTVTLRLRNAGNVNNTNLVATLLATNGVTAPSGPQTYGVLAGGGLPVGRSFSFTATGTNNGMVLATLRLQDGPNDLGTVSFPFALPRVQTFANSSPITIPDSGPASPYPSSIFVSGVTGTVGRVTVTLSNLTHTFVEDLDVLLVGPTGQKAVIFSDAGNPNAIASATVTLDDTAGVALPDNGPILSGAYTPADYEPGGAFNPPAPTGPYASVLSVFASQNPNGLWSLYVMDDTAGDAGSIGGGWSLSIYTITPVNQLVDVGLSARATPDPVRVGDAITYTFTVTNLGPNTATGLAFTNLLPSGLTLLSAGASQGSVITNGNAVAVILGSLAPSGSATVTVLARPGLAGSLTNSATIALSENDLNPANNSAAAVTTARLPVADLALTKLAPADLIVGSNISFTITVTNLGPETALNVTVSDPLPAGLTFASALSTSGSVTNLGGTVVAALGDLAPDHGAMITIKAVPGAPGWITNTALLSTGSNDTNTSNNAATALTQVLPPSPLIVTAGARLLTETITNAALDIGETVTAALSLRNIGSADVTNLVATLLAGQGVTGPSGPQSYGTLPAGGDAVSRPFTFTATGGFGDAVIATLQLQDGATDLGTVQFVFHLPGRATFANTNAISIPDNGIASPYPSTILVSGLTGLISRVTVSLHGLTHAFPDDLDLLLVGPAGHKRVILSDAGGGRPVTNVTITLDDAAGAPVPDAGQILSGSYQPADYEPGDAFAPPAPSGAAGGPLSLFNGSDPNGVWSLYVVDDATGDAGGIAGGWSLTIETLSTVNPVADLAISLSDAPDPLYVGGGLDYTIVVTNLGPSDATGVSVTNLLPAGLSYISGSASQGSVSTLGDLVTANLGDLPVGQGATVTVHLAAVLAGVHTGTASVVANETDLNPVNNLAQGLTTVMVPRPVRLEDVVVTNGQVQATLSGEPGLSYVIQASTNLLDWTPVLTNTLPGSGMAKFTDTDAPLFGQRFYRAVRLVP